MALNEPKPKKNCKLKPQQALPLLPLPSGEIYRFKGNFNGLGVVIDDEGDMKKIISMGYFGKATLSRNYPQFKGHQPEIVRDRVFQNRKKQNLGTNSAEKIIVLPDSDESESEEYFRNLKPQFQIDYSKISETVNLSLEEAFFLATAINCLDIKHKGQILGPEKVWDLFKLTDKYFVENYIAYYYFRAKNWVVKTGIKFGGDFLLYKQGPPFYHASYVVIIDILREDLQKIENKSRRSMTKMHLMGLNRLCETAGKELLICEIIWPNCLPLNQVSFLDLPKFSIKETIMKRWIPSQERQTK